MLLDIRPVLVVNGYVLLILAATMGIPLVVDLAIDGAEWPAFLMSMAVAGFVGLGMVLSARRRARAAPAGHQEATG